MYVITATAVVNLGTTALEPQPQFLEILQANQEPQPRFSENSQPIHHYYTYIHIETATHKVPAREIDIYKLQLVC